MRKMREKRHITFLSVAVSSLMFAFTAIAEDTPITKGVGYLTSVQDSDGAWNTDESKKMIDTVESFEALHRVNQGEAALNKSLAYISQLPETTAAMVAKKLFVLSSSTADVTPLVDLLAKWQKEDGGWGLTDSKRGSPSTTVWAIFGLNASKKYTATNMSGARDFLIHAQRADGSWSFTDETSLSDIVHTSMAVIALKHVQDAGYSSTELENAMSKAQKFLDNQKKADNSYGSSIVDAAWVYLAYSRIKQPSELQSLLSKITSSQQSNGSWNNKIYDTAVCLQALGAIQLPPSEPLPDLEIQEKNITFEPTAPHTGDPVKVRAHIYNLGDANAENVTVEVFNRDPRLGGISLTPVENIQVIPAGGSVIVEKEFATTGMVGPEQIVVFIDRNNSIQEISKANNAAAKILSVGGAPDLSVNAEGIVFSNASPKAFDDVTVTITVKNTGNEAAENIPIRILDGETELATLNLSGVNPGSSNKVILTTNFTAGSHTLTVQIDPDKFIDKETNRTNNTASKNLEVAALPVSAADLVLESIQVSPAAILEGAEAKVIVTVSNRGGSAVETPFGLKISNGETELHTFTVNGLASGQKAILTLDTNFAAGTYTLTALADSGNVIAEESKTNNTKNISFTVRSTSAPVTEADLVAVSLIPDKTVASIGDKIVVTAVIKNTGMTEANNITVRLYDGETVVGSMSIPSLTENQSANLQLETNFSEAGPHLMKLVVDPENKIAESNKNNNLATATITISETQRPDFVVTNLVFSKATPLPGEDLTITATVKNNGNAAAPASKLLLTIGNPFVDGALLIAEVDVPTLESGASSDVSTTTKFNSGSYNIYAYADSQQIIEELSEDNNSFNKSLSTSPLADLLVDASTISFSTTDLDNGNMISISCRVDNLGGASAENFKVDFAEKVNGEFLLIDTVTIASLASGTSTDVKVNWLAKTGEHEVVVIIDNENKVQEQNKENNTATKQGTFTRSGIALRLFKLENGTQTETDIFRPYELVKIVPEVQFPNAAFEVSVTRADGVSQSRWNENGIFYHSVGHNPAGTYNVDLIVFDENTGVFIDQVTRPFTVVSQYKVGDVSIRATPSLQRVTELQPVELTIIIDNLSNIDGVAAGTVKVTSPKGEVVLEQSIPEFTMTAGVQKVITLVPLADTFILDGRYKIEATITPKDNGQNPVVGQRNYDILPANTIKVNKTLSPLVLEPLGEGKVHVKIDIEGIGTVSEAAPIDLMLVLDTSGSMMDGNAFDLAREAATEFTNMLPNNARAGLVLFSDWARLAFPLSYDREGLIDSIYADWGGTNMGEGMKMTREHFVEESAPPRKRIEILLTDGDTWDYGTAVNEIQHAKDENIKIYTIGLGYYLNESLLKQIASETGGEYYFSPTPEDLQSVFKEVFETAVATAANDVIVTDTINTEKIHIEESSVIGGTPTSVDPGTGKIVWTVEKMAVGDKFSYEFDVVLNDLLPGETRVVNKNLNIDFASPDASQQLNIEVGEQSVTVGEMGKIAITADKEEYVSPESVDLTTTLTLEGNKIKKFASVEDLATGTLQNIDVTSKPGTIRLAAANVTSPTELVQNGDFESNLDKWSQEGYYISTNTLDGSKCLYFSCDPYGGIGAKIYQTVSIPNNVTEVKLSLKDAFNSYYYGGAFYRILICDTNGKTLKTLFRYSGENNWGSTLREFDLLEFVGQTVQIVLNLTGGGEMRIDNVSLKIVQTTYESVGTATYVIDAGQTAVWDKLRFNADTTGGGSVKFRVRPVDNETGNSSFAWSAEMTATNSQIEVEPSRFLALEVKLEAPDTARTPEISNLQLTYISYSDEDNLRVKVMVKDAGGNSVKEYVDIIPQLQRGRIQTFHLPFETAGVTPGDYQATAALYFRTLVAASDKDTFKILDAQPQDILDGKIFADKLEYTGGDTVRLTSRVMNKSTNSDLKNVTVKVTITNAAGEEIKVYDYSIANLLRDNMDNRNLVFAVENDLATGTYTVTQKVSIGETDAFTRITTFAVVASADQGKGLIGSVIPQPQTVKRRIGDLAFAASGRNTGNIDLTGVVFEVKLYDVTAQNVLKTYQSSATELPKDGNGYAENHQYGTKVELMPGYYPITLVAKFTFNGVAKEIPLDTNVVIVTNTPPVADAGLDQVLEATDMDTNQVVLNAGGSTDENSADAAKRDDIVKYEWKLGNRVIATAMNATVNLPLGSHSLTLTVTDSCGATSSDTVQIVLRDTVPPTITQMIPVNGTLTKELNGISAIVADACSGVNYNTLTLKLGETALAVNYDTATGKISSSLPADSADGWYNLTLTVSDYAGNQATSPEWRFGLDRTPPVITELAPEADMFGNSATPTISATITDAMSGVDPASLKVTIGETVLTASYDETTRKVTAVAPSKLADGWYDAKIEVADKVGNTATATWRVGIDATPPTISNMVPVADSEINQASQEISAMVTDALSGVKADTIVLKLDNVIVAHSYDPATGKVVFNAENLTSGIHAVNITVSDNAGNESNATWQFNVQLRVPGSEYLLFHNSQNGQLDISGGNKTINGMAHSHANIKVRGNNTTIIGSTTAVGTISVNGSGHNIALQQSNAEAIPMPVYPYEYYVANATYTYNGGKTFGKGETIPDGIHLVNGDVTVQGDINANITIVATGSISVKSKTVSLTYADTKYKVALYSKDGNISFTSNGVTVKGVIYAPSGECKVASSTSNFTGAIVGNTVDISGQDMTLNPLDDGTENNGGAQ